MMTRSHFLASQAGQSVGYPFGPARLQSPVLTGSPDQQAQHVDYCGRSVIATHIRGPPVLNSNLLHYDIQVRKNAVAYPIETLLSVERLIPALNGLHGLDDTIEVVFPTRLGRGRPRYGAQL
jgi:hypothetical protein